MSRKQLIFGIALICLGLIFLAQSLDIIWITFGEIIRLIFPIALILAGIWLIMRKRREEQERDAQVHFYGDPASVSSPDSSRVFSEPTSPPPPPPGPDPSTSTTQDRPRTEGGRTKYSAFIGDLHIRCDHVDMRNVEISEFIGDVEVNLGEAKLEVGLSRMIISQFIGDVRILIPRGMAVFANGSSFIGDIDILGQRSSGWDNNLDYQTSNYAAADKKLYIAIKSFIGDIRVYEV